MKVQSRGTVRITVEIPTGVIPACLFLSALFSGIFQESSRSVGEGTRSDSPTGHPPTRRANPLKCQPTHPTRPGICTIRFYQSDGVHHLLTVERRNLSSIYFSAEHDLSVYTVGSWDKIKNFILFLIP